MLHPKGVVRIDSASTHGWQVRVYRAGRTHSRLFSDRRHGGRETALAAALAFRSALEREVRALPGVAARRRPAPPERALGISRAVKHDPRGVPHEVYAVSWSPAPGVGRSTSVSIRRYGEAGAFERACALRWARMRETHGARYAVAAPQNLFHLKAAVDARHHARTGDG